MAEFEVIATGVTLENRVGATGWPCKTVGSVARLSTGRLVARWERRWSDGTIDHACATYDPNAKLDMVHCGGTFDHAASFESKMQNTVAGWHRLGPSDSSLLAAEVQRFSQQFPLISTHLQLPTEVAKTFTAFDPGVVYFAKEPALTAELVRLLVESHANGRWGDYGVEGSITEDQNWTLQEQPPEICNRAAIAARSGAVRSRFPLPVTKGAPPHYVNVITLLSVRGARTLVTLE